MYLSVPSIIKLSSSSNCVLFFVLFHLSLFFRFERITNEIFFINRKLSVAYIFFLNFFSMSQIMEYVSICRIRFYYDKCMQNVCQIHTIYWANTNQTRGTETIAYIHRTNNNGISKKKQSIKKLLLKIASIWFLVVLVNHTHSQNKSGDHFLCYFYFYKEFFLREKLKIFYYFYGQPFDI